MNQFFNKKHAFLFQGVGVEYQSYLQLLDEEQKEILNFYCSIIQKEIEIDLWDYLFNSSITKYNKVFYDWIAIYTIDYIVYRTYTDFGIEPGMFLGYSMGLITALACGKAISFEAGLDMLLCIFEYLESPLKQEAMAVIVGMTCNDVERIIQGSDVRNYVDLASENNENCIVISGIKSAVDEIMRIATNEGALKAKVINTPYACHSHYAAIGIERYVEFISKLQVFNCTVPIISSYNQNIIQDSSDIKKELEKNTTGRMGWKASIEKAIDKDFYSFVEVSLDDSISKFSKLINMDCEFFTYKKFLNIKSKIVR